MRTTRRDIRRRRDRALAAGSSSARHGVRPGRRAGNADHTVVGRDRYPAVGLGTWITFNVGDDPVLRDECAEVMAAFFAAGGRMIDSSPMYGSSQPVIGYGLAKLGRPRALFSAEKVWTSSAADGPAQIERSRRLLGRAALRPRAGPQSASPGRSTADAVADEGRRADTLCRDHHLGRPPARSRSRRSCAASRSTSCRSPTTSSTARRRSACCRWRASAASR